MFITVLLVLVKVHLVDPPCLDHSIKKMKKTKAERVKPAGGIKPKKLVDSSGGNVHLNNMQPSISEGGEKISENDILVH